MLLIHVSAVTHVEGTDCQTPLDQVPYQLSAPRDTPPLALMLLLRSLRAREQPQRPAA